MHRTGHWLGMDVHDCGSYVEPGEVGQAHERKDPLSGETITDRPSCIPAAGMALTIEPGLYVRPSDKIREEFWNIGRDVPVKAEEIEALMRWIWLD